MENNQEKIPGNEKQKNIPAQGVTQNPSRYNQKVGSESSRQNMSSDDEEVNPSKLDRDEVDLDKGGVNNFGSGDENASTLDDEEEIESPTPTRATPNQPKGPVSRQ